MATLARTYANVLKELGEGGVKKTLSYMKVRGHLSLLPEIVRILEREPAKPDAIVTVAKESDVKKLSSRIATALASLGKSGTKPSLRIDPRSVGGFSARAGSRSIDQSYRSALISIYRNAVEQ
jgi:F0F1-type ATP synthase delta subunit